ncbi:MAG TPA: hypothetical protein VL240_02855 [Candidatus Binatia bacterium]|nr:hypothetical protein [Candidatus Binatia bacterium]
MRKLPAWLVLLFPVVVTIAVSAQSGSLLYENGVYCPGYCHDGWQINQGLAVSDSFVLTKDSRVTGFDFWAWEFPGDRVLRVQWSITSSEFGGIVYGSGSVPVSHDGFIALNEWGFDIDKVTVFGLNVALPSGTYWLNLQNATDEQHLAVFWDENSGGGCHSLGCPSLASENQLGTIPSETFDIQGTNLSDEESGGNDSNSRTGLLWGPVLIGLAATLRRFVL